MHFLARKVEQVCCQGSKKGYYNVDNNLLIPTATLMKACLFFLFCNPAAAGWKGNAKGTQLEKYSMNIGTFSRESEREKCVIETR